MTNVHTDFEKSSFLWSKFLTFWQVLFFWISRTSVLLLELEKLYESFWDIFIFVTDFFQFLITTLVVNFPYIRITLRARNALRVICNNGSWGRSTFPGAEPPAGPKKIDFLQFSCKRSEILVIFGVMKKPYPGVELFLKRIDGHHESISG